MYKTSLLATGGFNEKCGILGVGTKAIYIEFRRI